jgi:hypothetical protein
MTIEKYQVTDGIFTQTMIRASGKDLGPELKKAFVSHRLEALLQRYENQAQAILKAQGYPLDLNGLWTINDNDLPIQIFYIKEMLLDFQIVRDMVAKKDAEFAAVHMANAIQSAIRAQLQPLVPVIKRGEQFTAGTREGFKQKVLGPKQVRENFVDHLIRRNQSRQALKDISEGRKVTSFPGFEVSRIYRRGRTGELEYYVRFTSSVGSSFVCSVHTLKNTIEKRLKRVQ